MTTKLLRTPILKRTASLLSAIGLGLVLAHASKAQDLVGPDDLKAVTIDRDIAELRPYMVPRPDVDVFDTALVFNNPGSAATTVLCGALNANGRGIGRSVTVVPANGVRFLFASDIADGKDFIGSVVCKARNAVIPAGFLVGAAVTDIKARVERNWNNSVIRFPVVASY